MDSRGARCAACGHQNPEENEGFCENCGTPIGDLNPADVAARGQTAPQSPRIRSDPFDFGGPAQEPPWGRSPWEAGTPGVAERRPGATFIDLPSTVIAYVSIFVGIFGVVSAAVGLNVLALYYPAPAAVWTIAVYGLAGAIGIACLLAGIAVLRRRSRLLRRALEDDTSGAEIALTIDGVSGKVQTIDLSAVSGRAQPRS